VKGGLGGARGRGPALSPQIAKDKKGVRGLSPPPAEGKQEKGRPKGTCGVSPPKKQWVRGLPMVHKRKMRVNGDDSKSLLCHTFWDLGVYASAARLV
jgi:hypothetical protein